MVHVHSRSKYSGRRETGHPPRIRRRIDAGGSRRNTISETRKAERFVKDAACARRGIYCPAPDIQPWKTAKGEIDEVDLEHSHRRRSSVVGCCHAVRLTHLDGAMHDDAMKKKDDAKSCS
jgi:hypothetical protein